MVRKPGSMYRAIKGQSYTRKEYMGGVPGNRIVQYDHGDPKGTYDLAVHLVINETSQVRHSSLEAARISANRHIAKWAGTNYYFKVRVYPHEVIREHKVAVGAGADRVSQGMRAAFGVPVGTAARVKAGQEILTIKIPAAMLPHAKAAMKKAYTRIASPCRIVVEPLKKPKAA